jgi:Tol biopolymer transport system component
MDKRAVISILETVNVKSGERKTIQEFDYLIEAPSFMADGKTIVYNSDGHIFRINTDSGDITQLDSSYCNHCNNDHVLAPDMSAIAVSHHTFEDGQSRVYVIPFNGAPPKLITPIAPSYLHGWSPDGSTLAYCAERNGEYDIYTIPAVGGEETQLTSEPGLSDGPEYSPDGKHIWFNSVRTGLMQVWRMNADGSEQTHMLQSDSNDWFPHISPDNQTVVFISYKQRDVNPGDHPPNKNVEIKIMSAEGGKAETLVKLFGGQGTLNVNSWHPDSETIAFVSYRLP